MTIEDLMQHAATLYRFAPGRVRDHHAAEDLVQDCLTAAWQKKIPSMAAHDCPPGFQAL